MWKPPVNARPATTATITRKIMTGSQLAGLPSGTTPELPR
jgi:hypothetical protein